MSHKDNDVVKEIHVKDGGIHYPIDTTLLQEVDILGHPLLGMLKDVDGICTETDPIWYVPELFVRGGGTMAQHLIAIDALQKVPYTIRYQTERTQINTVPHHKEKENTMSETKQELTKDWGLYYPIDMDVVGDHELFGRPIKNVLHHMKDVREETSRTWYLPLVYAEQEGFCMAGYLTEIQALGTQCYRIIERITIESIDRELIKGRD